MNKIFTLIFVAVTLALFSSTATAQCPTVTSANQTDGGNRINLAFADAAAASAFLASIGGTNASVTANPGGTSSTVAIFGGNNNRIRILNLSGITGGAGAYNGEITFNDAMPPFSCIFGTGPLPVTLTSFTGKKMEKSIQLEWKTESELNNDYFVVERSMDGRNFEQLKEVSGKGNSTERVVYTFEDQKPESATNYYRLRQVDYDGTESFSDIITVKFKNTRLDLNLYPTLVREEVNLDLTNFENENVLINILNATGQIILSKEVSSSEIVTLSLENLNLSEGMYYARCQSLGQITIGKFLILK